MSLYDHMSQYLDAGWHDVQVTAVKSVTAHTGTDGVEFTVQNDKKASRGVTFWLTEKAVWRLAGFAKSCGLSDDDMKAYDEDAMASHRTLINRRVSVLVEKGEKYHDIVNWQPIDSETPAVVPPPQPEPTAADVPGTTGDDIPF